MTDSTSTKDKDAQIVTQQSTKPEAENRNALKLRPLPQNRPIAANVGTETSNDLMGYLD